MLHGTISLAYIINTPKDTSPKQDRAVEEPEIKTSQEPLISREDRSLDSETPIHQVQPVLGMTPTENSQLWDRI